MVVARGGALDLRTADEPEWRQLLGTEGANNPTFSPDGQSVAFSGGGMISKVPITGGPALPIASGSTPHWGLPDVIVYQDGGAIYRVGASGGEAEVLFESDSIQASRPHILPNGKGVVFGTGTGGDALTSRIMYLEIETGEVRELVSSGNQPWYVSTGHLIYGHGNQSLMGVAFDADAGEAGDPITLLPSLSVRTGGASMFAVSETGTLIYDATRGGDGTGVQRLLVEVDTSGVETPLPISPSDFEDPRYSPDGSRIAYQDEEGIRIYSFATGANPLFASGNAYNPAWSASGEYVYFTIGDRASGDLYRRRADSSEEAVLMSDRPERQEFAAVSADDSIALVVESNSAITSDLLLMRQGGSGVEFEDFLATEWMDDRPSISPDGQWVAYQSNPSGEFRIYVQSFPIATGQQSVSQEEGIEPRWHPDGRTLYYHNFGGQYMAVDVTTEPTFSLSSVPRVLFESPQYREWDIHPEGSRFVVVANQSQANQSQVVEGNNNEGTEVYIVTNWFTELLELFGN